MTLLRPDHDYYVWQTDRLKSLTGGLTTLTITHQKIVAEIVILRLFDVLTNLISTVAEKIAAGCTYIDGSSPLLKCPAAGSRQKAISLFCNYGRSKPIRSLRWTIPDEIVKNVCLVVDEKDTFAQVIRRHSLTIDELRKVRNRIAHNNARSRKQYREVVLQYYGASLNNVPPGTLLIAEKVSPPLLNQYVEKATICAKELVRR